MHIPRLLLCIIGIGIETLSKFGNNLIFAEGKLHAAHAYENDI